MQHSINETTKANIKKARRVYVEVDLVTDFGRARISKPEAYRLLTLADGLSAPLVARWGASDSSILYLGGRRP